MALAEAGFLVTVAALAAGFFWMEAFLVAMAWLWRMAKTAFMAAMTDQVMTFNLVWLKVQQIKNINLKTETSKFEMKIYNRSKTQKVRF